MPSDTVVKEPVGDWPPEEVCEKNVDVPTIVIGEGGEKNIVFVQWYGETRRYDLEKRQFLFPLTASADDIMWFGHPEMFQVAYLGRLRDWSTPGAAREIAKSRGCSLDEHVCMVSSSLYTLAGSNGPRCACYLGPMVLIGDRNVGVIEPQHFWDQAVNVRNQKAVEGQALQ
jgi:hypothetical protein